jgi:glycerol-3-phosphate acyltransferase PlsY
MSGQLTLLVTFTGAFLLGSVPVGVIVGRAAAGIDIRRYGTGNIGASNVYRNLGLQPAAIVGVISFLQGLLPVTIADLSAGPTAAGVAAVGAVAGYGWSPFLRLRGGRAVGTATGALAFLSPKGFIVLLVSYALGRVADQMGAGVLLGLVCYLLASVAIRGFALTPWAVAAVVAMIIIKRLEGVGGDLRRGDGAEAVIGRILFDRRPRQRLVGRIES